MHFISQMCSHFIPKTQATNFMVFHFIILSVWVLSDCKFVSWLFILFSELRWLNGFLECAFNLIITKDQIFSQSYSASSEVVVSVDLFLQPAHMSPSPGTVSQNKFPSSVINAWVELPRFVLRVLLAHFLQIPLVPQSTAGHSIRTRQPALTHLPGSDSTSSREMFMKAFSNPGHTEKSNNSTSALVIGSRSIFPSFSRDKVVTVKFSLYHCAIPSKYSIIIK